MCTSDQSLLAVHRRAHLREGELIKSYFRLITISSILCIPVIYFVSSSWISSYATWISLTSWFYVMPIISLMLLVAISAGLQTVKAALANPIEELRHK